MKKAVFRALGAAMLLAACAGLGYSQTTSQSNQSAKSDMKEAGHATARASKKTATATKTQTKKGAHKAAQKTEQGSKKVQQKTEPQ